jgi:hypothetical protein
MRFSASHKDCSPVCNLSLSRWTSTLPIACSSDLFSVSATLAAALAPTMDILRIADATVSISISSGRAWQLLLEFALMSDDKRTQTRYT